MANIVYSPQEGNIPRGLRNTNPQSSNYANDSEYAPEESNLIAKAIQYVIFDSAPAQFAAMKVLFEKGIGEVDSDEFEYLEHSFGRTPGEIVAGAETAASAAGLAPVPGSSVSNTFNVSADTLQRISISDIITYPNGEEAVIVDITGNIVTVNSRTNAGLPAIAVGDFLAIRSTIMADAQDKFDHYDRLETITRYNYVQFFLRAKRWGHVELQKYINKGTTDYLEKDKQQKIRQLRYDMFISFWNGHRGEYTLEGNRVAKSMGGIYPTMIAAGSAQSNPTLGGLPAAFETLAMSTNFKSLGEKRFIYGTHQALHELSKAYKLPGLRYTSEDKDINLDLEMIEVGGAKYVMVPCEIWREPSCFPADWAKRLIILDQDTVEPVKMKGIPFLEMGETDNLQNGTREQYVDYWCKGQLSLKFNNPLASFILDIQ